MTTIARRINSIPARSAIQTWQTVVELTSLSGSPARQELQSIEGIAASIISDETAKDSPVVFFNSGPCVKIYCLYGDDAIAGDKSNENSLGVCPTTDDWQVSLPCQSEDLDWVTKALAKKTARITARIVGTQVSEAFESKSAQQTTFQSIDSQAFFRS